MASTSSWGCRSARQPALTTHSGPDTPSSIAPEPSPVPSLGYRAEHRALGDYVFLNWAVELGEFGRPDGRPDLALAFGGDHSAGPLVILDGLFELGPEQTLSINHRSSELPEWEWGYRPHSQVHFAELDPTCEGDELLLSSYTSLGARGGGLVMVDACGHERALGCSSGVMDFDVGDVDVDGVLELVVAYKDEHPCLPERSKTLAISSVLVGSAGPEQVHVARLAQLDLGAEDPLRSLGFVAAPLRPGAEITHEILNVRLFDVDGDGQLELIASATGHSLLVVEWQAAVDSLTAADPSALGLVDMSYEVPCDDQQSDKLWCGEIDAIVVAVEPVVWADQTWLVTATDCHPSHGVDGCTGELRVHCFARPGQARLQPVPCALTDERVAIDNGPRDILTGLQLIESARGGLQALVYLTTTEIRGQREEIVGGELRAYDFSTRQWRAVFEGDGPLMIKDIEALPRSAAPTLVDLSIAPARRRIDLPGPGPHRIRELQAGHLVQGRCQPDRALAPCPAEHGACWDHEPRSRSVAVGVEALPQCWLLRLERHRAPALAVADAWPRKGSGLWLLSPPADAALTDDLQTQHP